MNTTDAFWFCCEVLTIGMSVLGLLAMFKAIVDDGDDKIADAFQQGLDAGLNAQLGNKTETNGRIGKKVLTKALKKR